MVGVSPGRIQSLLPQGGEQVLRRLVELPLPRSHRGECAFDECCRLTSEPNWRDSIRSAPLGLRRRHRKVRAGLRGLRRADILPSLGGDSAGIPAATANSSEFRSRPGDRDVSPGPVRGGTAARELPERWCRHPIRSVRR